MLTCSVCRHFIRTDYYITPRGNVCALCFNPQNLCFTCSRQMTPSMVLRLADNRPCCSDCAATAVYQVNKELIAEITPYLTWQPRLRVVFGTTDVIQLHRLRQPVNSTAFGLCQVLVKGEPPRVRPIQHRILVLFGLPRQICLATLVHELFHAWLFENVEIDRFSDGETEWLCEQMALNFLHRIKAEEHWRRKVQNSRDRFPAVGNLANRSQQTIVKFLVK